MLNWIKSPSRGENKQCLKPPLDIYLAPYYEGTLATPQIFGSLPSKRLVKVLRSSFDKWSQSAIFLSPPGVHPHISTKNSPWKKTPHPVAFGKDSRTSLWKNNFQGEELPISRFWFHLVSLWYFTNLDFTDMSPGSHFPYELRYLFDLFGAAQNLGRENIFGSKRPLPKDWKSISWSHLSGMQGKWPWSLQDGPPESMVIQWSFLVPSIGGR